MPTAEEFQRYQEGPQSPQERVWWDRYSHRNLEKWRQVCDDKADAQPAEPDVQHGHEPDFEALHQAPCKRQPDHDAARSHLDVTAHNIANESTPGYHRDARLWRNSRRINQQLVAVDHRLAQVHSALVESTDHVTASSLRNALSRIDAGGL